MKTFSRGSPIGEHRVDVAQGQVLAERVAEAP